MSYTFNGWDIVMTGISAMLIFGVLPAMICFAFKYTVNLDHIVLQKRYSRIVFYEIIIYIIKLLCSSSVFITMVISSQNVESLQVTISILLSNISAYCLYLTWVWRFYLLMYDMSWIIAAKNDHWQHVINPTYKDSTANWFLSNKKKYGNTKWTFFHLFLPLLLIGIPFQNMYIFLTLTRRSEEILIHDVIKTMDYVIGCVPFILLIIIYCRIPSFQDRFFIHNELQRILLAISIQYVAFFGTVSIRLLSPHSSLWMLTYFISVLCEFAAMSIATIWVANKVESIINSQLYHIRKFESKSRNEYVSIDSPRNNEYTTMITDKSQSQILLAQGQGTGNGVRSKISITKDAYTLEQILCMNQSFSLFMMNLGNEFSQEILLSFIEMIQYKQLIAYYVNSNNLTQTAQYRLSINQSQFGYNYQCKEYYETINFPSNVPRSYIIYGSYRKNSHSLIDDLDFYCNQHEFVEKLKIIVWKIWEKYISTNAQFQINVPFTTQRHLNKMIQNERNWKNNNNIQLPALLHIFDDCIYETYSLMMDSYRRFKKTQRYLTLQLSVESAH